MSAEDATSTYASVGREGGAPSMIDRIAGNALSSPTRSCAFACSGSRYVVPMSKIPAGLPGSARRTQDDMGESPCRANSMSISSSAGRTRRMVRLRTHGRAGFGISRNWAIHASFETVGIRRVVCPSRGKNRRTAWSSPHDGEVPHGRTAEGDAREARGEKRAPTHLQRDHRTGLG